MATIHKVQELILEINSDEIDEYLSYDKDYLYNCDAKILLEEKCNLVVKEVIKAKFLEKGDMWERDIIKQGGLSDECLLHI